MKGKSQFNWIGLSAIVLMLSGCTGLSPDRYLVNKQKFMLDQGDPPAYVEGYVDGCSVGRRLAGERSFVYRKDTGRFEKDALYARGWQEGQINCRNEAIEQDFKNLVNPIKNSAVTKEKEKKLSAKDAEKHQKMEAERKKAEVEMNEIWEELKK